MKTRASSVDLSASLSSFRAIAAEMTGPTDWQWVGKWESQRHFGITKERAEALAAKHGGIASAMDDMDRLVCLEDEIDEDDRREYVADLDWAQGDEF